MEAIIQSYLNADIGLPLFSSLVTGMLIGLDRELNSKPAGIRTHALVCFASTLLTLAAARQAEWTMTLATGTEIVSDPARMAHGILTGIGFLGAGVIFREGSSVQGLTTAASLWITAALGILFGVGMYWLALSGAIATLVVLVVLRLFYAFLPVRTEIRLHISADADSEFRAATLRSLLAAQKLPVRAISQSLNEGTAQLQFATSTLVRRSAEADTLLDALTNLPGVRSYAMIPAEEAAAYENVQLVPRGAAGVSRSARDDG